MTWLSIKMHDKYSKVQEITKQLSIFAATQ